MLSIIMAALGIETLDGEFAVFDAYSAGMAPHVQVDGTATKGGDDMDVDGDSIRLYELFPNLQHNKSLRAFGIKPPNPFRLLGSHYYPALNSPPPTPRPSET
jgi:hypothetical protein